MSISRPEQCSKRAQVQTLIEAVHLFLAHSPSALLMLNIEDLEASVEQVNLPGPLVGYPCWRRRLDRTIEQIFGEPWVRHMLDRVNTERLIGPE